jgi:hypothetical protein
MRNLSDDGFDELFNSGYKFYISGDWARSEDFLGQCLRLRPFDGPSKTLKKFIESENGSAPSGWKGYRELTEK